MGNHVRRLPGGGESQCARGVGFEKLARDESQEDDREDDNDRGRRQAVGLEIGHREGYSRAEQRVRDSRALYS